MRQILRGAGISVIGTAILTTVMILLRPHISIATAALVLVIPVVLGCSVGGFKSGLIAVLTGFLAYDFFFIPPYYTLSVGAPQNWIALIVYVIVMLVVSKVVDGLQKARFEAQRQENNANRLYSLTDLLIADSPPEQILQAIVHTVQQTFSPRWVALLLPDEHSDLQLPTATNKLHIAATDGMDISDAEKKRLMVASSHPHSLGTGESHDDIFRVALSAQGRPVGVLAVGASGLGSPDLSLLRTYANQAALTIERNRLQKESIRNEVLEQVDHWRRALIGAVSHDLRTPLASIKAAITTLREYKNRASVTSMELPVELPLQRPAELAADATALLSEGHQAELMELIEIQSDRLDRLVSNLLDMTRFEAGSRPLHLELVDPVEIVDNALESVVLSGTDPQQLKASGVSIIMDIPNSLPVVHIDRILMTQVLVNLLENAIRHSPDNAEIVIGLRVASNERVPAPKAASTSAPIGRSFETEPRGKSPQTGGAANTGNHTDSQVVEVFVTDQGPGVALNERSRVFQMFNRLSAGGGRAGLGLNIAKTFVEGHGQYIRVEDGPDGGASFIFSMPIGANEESRLNAHANTASEQETDP